jgi:CubicO group peptidase (beta-lactamase class C family)
MIMRGWSLSLALLASLCSAAAAQDQKLQLPPPEATDPVALGLMKGFPPPPDKVVTLANTLKFPNGRWTYHHLREVGPTANIWRGAKSPSVLRQDLRPLDDVAFTDDKSQQTTIAEWQKNTYTDALLVLHKGRIVYEKYYVGETAEQPHALWSMTKSFTGLLATILINDGKLDPNAKIAQYIPELASSAWGDATLQQTLDMTTGLHYDEVFTDPKSDVFRYVIATGLLPAPAGYGGPRSLLDFLKTVGKQGEHGAGFQYKSVNTEVVGWVLQRVTGASYAELVSEKIWRNIGAEQDGFVWVDPAGAQAASIGLNATLRDLGRFGEMLRNDGRTGEQQIVAKAVLDEIRKGGDREKFKASGQTVRAGYSYHNQWWISHDASGSFEAKGLNGQHIHINPAAELVIVKLSSHPVGNTLFTHALDRRAFEAIANALQ